MAGFTFVQDADVVQVTVSNADGPLIIVDGIKPSDALKLAGHLEACANAAIRHERDKAWADDANDADVVGDDVT